MSIWQRGKIPGHERRFALGAYLPHRKLMSPAYLPTPRARVGLRYKKPVWYSLVLQLAAQQTGFTSASVAPNFRLMAILGLSTQASPADGLGAFQAQIFDTARRQGFMDKPITDLNFTGTGQDPNFLKYPYRFSGTTPVNVKIQNRALAQATITIVLYGVAD